MNFRLVDCGKEWKKGIDYYVLGFCFDDAFVNNEYLAQHMQHWKEKDQWFNHEDATTNRKEIWHGSRFIELSWDITKETSLPSLRPNCGSTCIFPAEFVQMHEPGTGDLFTVTCDECFEKVEITANFMKGSPLNQAFFFQEDGFNAFSKKTRSIPLFN